MIFGTLLPLLLALFPAFVLSSLELHPEDVPGRCRSICEPVANLTSTCDVDDGSMSDENEDLLERQCICTNDSFDVANRTSLCASCIDQASGNGTTGTNGTSGTGGTGGTNSTGSTNSTGQANINSIMSVCGFSSQSFASNMTSATSANVTATRPSGTEALTTTISTGVAQTGIGGGAGGGGGGGPDETAAPGEGAGARVGVSNVGILGALVAGLMMGL